MSRQSSLPVIELIGAPTDVGAGVRGTSMGPDALRVADLDTALRLLGFHVVDCGDLAGPLNPRQPAANGYRHLGEVHAWNALLFNAVLGSLSRNALPVVLGGDHSLAIGSISAVAQDCRRRGKRLRVLWLDAHTDFNTSAMTPSGNIHGMPVACLCGHGPMELISLSDRQPAIRATEVRQVGIRSVDEGEKQFVNQTGLTVYDMRYIDEVGMRATVERALEGLDENTHLHVSFDVDFLDPDIAPGAGTPVLGGVTYREAQLCMEMIADCGRLGSVDVVEINPARDVQNRTALLAVDLLSSLFGKSTLVRPTL
jgi:arginase